MKEGIAADAAAMQRAMDGIQTDDSVAAAPVDRESGPVEEAGPKNASCRGSNREEGQAEGKPPSIEDSQPVGQESWEEPRSQESLREKRDEERQAKVKKLKGVIPPKYWGWALTDFPEALRATAQTFMSGEKLSSLYIHGPTGTGKSSYASAVFAACALSSTKWYSLDHPERMTSDAEFQLKIRVFANCDESDQDIGMQVKTEADSYWWGIARARLLWFDDLAVNRPSSYVKGKLSSLLQWRYEYAGSCKTIITSNRSLDDIQDLLGESISSRLQEGIVLHLDGEDLRRRRPKHLTVSARIGAP